MRPGIHGIFVEWGDDTIDAGDKPTDAGNDTDKPTDADTEPTPCDNGTFDHDSNPETPCVPWTVCPLGSHVAASGTATTDRECATCEPGTFSTLDNQDTCSPWTLCEPGTHVSVPGTTTTDATCEACESGSYCEGGNAPVLDCAVLEGFDHDTDPATPCMPWTTCQNNEYVSVETTPHEDRRCTPCPGQSTTLAPMPPCVHPTFRALPPPRREVPTPAVWTQTAGLIAGATTFGAKSRHLTQTSSLSLQAASAPVVWMKRARFIVGARTRTV